VFSKTITIITQTKEGYEKQIIDGVFFDDVKGVSSEKWGIKEAYSIKVVIPFDSKYKIAEGDYIFKGILAEDYPDITSIKKVEKLHLITTLDIKDYGSSPCILIMGK